MYVRFDRSFGRKTSNDLASSSSRIYTLILAKVGTLMVFSRKTDYVFLRRCECGEERLCQALIQSCRHLDAVGDDHAPQLGRVTTGQHIQLARRQRKL